MFNKINKNTTLALIIILVIALLFGKIIPTYLAIITALYFLFLSLYDKRGWKFSGWKTGSICAVIFYVPYWLAVLISMILFSITKSQIVLFFLGDSIPGLPGAKMFGQLCTLSTPCMEWGEVKLATIVNIMKDPSLQSMPSEYYIYISLALLISILFIVVAGAIIGTIVAIAWNHVIPRYSSKINKLLR